MGEKGIEPASSGNKFQVFLRKFPGIPAAVIALLALLITGNRIANGVITFALMIAGFIAILAIGIVLSKKKKLTDEDTSSPKR